MANNNDLGTTQAIPGIPNFSPGSGDGTDPLVYLRQIDGHMLGANGIAGNNAHDPSAPHADFSEIPALAIDQE